MSDGRTALPAGTMRRTALLLGAAAFAISAGPAPAAAQAESFRITGYLEHQLSGAETPAGWGHVDYDRLRLDLEGRAGRGVLASAGVVWQLYRGRTTGHLSDVVPEALRAQLPADQAFTIDDRQYLNHAYISLQSGALAVTAGKQYLAWGRGLVFNPTELFRPKALFDPAYEREGVGAISAAVELGALSDAALVYVPEESWRESAKVARVRGHVGGFDVSALAAELWERDAAADLLAGLGGAGGPVEPGALARRRTVGGDVSGELGGIGMWAEGTWSALRDDDWLELTVGGNATFPGDVLFAIEGYFDGRGEWNEPYPLEHWLALAVGERRTLGRTLVFSSLSRPSGDLMTLGVAALANAGDHSAALLPNMAYSFAENVDLFLQLIVAVGPDGTEFGTRGHGGLIRGRVYF